MFIVAKKNFFSVLSKLFLLFLLGNTITTESVLAASVLEQEILQEINRARTNPQEYGAWLESLKQYYDGIMLKLPGERAIRTNRGLIVLEEAISFVKAQSPLAPLTSVEDLQASAKDKVTQFLNNRRNTNLDNISYGKATPKAIVMHLIVDENFRDRRHRFAIFNPNYQLTGVACQDDSRYTQVCAIAYEVSSHNLAMENGSESPEISAATGNNTKPNSSNVAVEDQKIRETESLQNRELDVSTNSVLIEKTERGVLEIGDKTIPNDGSLYDSYPLEVKAGDSLIISVESRDFDTFLAVMDQEGNIIEQNDDISDRNSNSRLRVTFTNNGTYNVIVNAYDEGGRGKYVLTVRK